MKPIIHYIDKQGKARSAYFVSFDPTYDFVVTNRHETNTISMLQITNLIDLC